MPTPNNPAPAPSAPESRRGSLWDNNAFLIAISLVMGFISWMIVTMYFDTQAGCDIYDAEINYANSASTYTALGLDIVEKPEDVKVHVSVEGNSTVIGNISADDIMVYPSYASVKGSGEATLRLNARITNTSEFSGDIKLTVVSPTTVDVVFDEVSEKTFAVETDTSGITIAESYILNKSAAVPAEITLRGPTSELDRIESVVAPVTSEEPVSETTTLPAALELRGEDGELLSLEYTSMDSETANVTLTVYQVRELPLTVDFIGVPSGFDTSSLHYQLSQETLRIAGPAKVVGALESLSVVSFDLSQNFAFDRDSQHSIELPSGLVSQDGVEAVTITFDTSDMGSTTLNVSNIRAINVPSNYDIDILSSMVNGVTLYGPKEEIEELSANSVLAQVDCQSISLTAGQQTLPVNIQIPSSSRIFATGSYTVQCEITAK